MRRPIRRKKKERKAEKNEINKNYSVRVSCLVGLVG